MRIKKVHIVGFRCLDDVSVDFDDITTFIGPNGFGKSTILRALDWFFNGGNLSEEDVFSGAQEKKIEVSVEFIGLTEKDRAALGRYAIPGIDTVTIWRRWEDGRDKMYGRGRAQPLFASIREGANATERRQRYNEFRTSQPEFGLPSIRKDAELTTVLDQWEADHPDELEDVDITSTTHLFGFYGQAALAGLFDYVFVTADLRASEQAQDNNKAIIGRILEQAVDRSGANADLAELMARVATEQSDIHNKHFGEQLKGLSERMTAAVSAYTAGREIQVSAQDLAVPQQEAQFRVRIMDDDTETSVERQGHGFQRALIISALQLLAEGKGQEGRGTICLAIEEPELFQHPLQARIFASVLRSLATDPKQAVQVTYATHSPYFIEPRAFHQIRRVSRLGGGSRGAVTVSGATLDDVLKRLDTYVDEQHVRRQLDGVCMGSLAEALFAERVLLVEGTTERGMLNGVLARSQTLAKDGICVAECGGKTSMLLPFAILEQLGVSALVVVDNDKHLEDDLARAKAENDSSRAKSLEANVTNTKSWNRRLLKFFGCTEVDWPSGKMTDNLIFNEPTLEALVEDSWPEWATARDELMSRGLGFSGKDGWTYHDACLIAGGDIPGCLSIALEQVRTLNFLSIERPQGR